MVVVKDSNDVELASVLLSSTESSGPKDLTDPGPGMVMWSSEGFAGELALVEFNLAVVISSPEGSAGGKLGVNECFDGKAVRLPMVL